MKRARHAAAMRWKKIEVSARLTRWQWKNMSLENAPDDVKLARFDCAAGGKSDPAPVPRTFALDIVKRD